MTECQGCGAWNDASRAVCVLCDTPLAETDEWDAAAELPPLPPLPDGGLRASMPAWLRDPPRAEPSLPPLATEPPPVSPIDTEPPLGPRADPRTFLTDDDFPRWLRDLAARHAETERRPPARTGIPPRPEPSPRESTPLGSRPSPVALSPSAMTTDPEPVPGVPPMLADLPDPGAPEVAPVAAPKIAPPVLVAGAREERRRREPWESLLLVLLVVGVAAAAIWALAANGVIRIGP